LYGTARQGGADKNKYFYKMNAPQWILDLADLPAVHRLQHLESNADEVKEGIYYKNFDEDEMEQLRIANAQADIEIRQREDELKNVSEPIKKRLTELKTAKKHTVTNLKEGREEINGKLFVFVENGIAYDIDQHGTIINHRPFGKRQQTVFQQLRQADGTNG
jgi:hypothetical protein